MPDSNRPEIEAVADRLPGTAPLLDLGVGG